MEKISFSLMQLIYESSITGERYISPDLEAFNDITEKFGYTLDDTYYEISIEKTEQYIWFNFDYNKPEPIDDNLTNIFTGDKTTNQRTNSYVELIHQVFFFYNFKDKILYVSNSKKKSLLQSVLKNKFQKDFVVKTYFKEFNEFINTLKSCSKISFTHSNNLFSSDDKRRQALIDLVGTDAPENFTIEAAYNSHKVKNFLRELFESKQNHALSGLLICGKDESDFEITYNVDSFIKKIEIDCQKDSNGKYISEIIKLNLISNTLN